MNTPVSPRTVVIALIGTMASIQAQNLDLRGTMPMSVQSGAAGMESAEPRHFSAPLPAFGEIPAMEKAPSEFHESSSLVSQDVSLAARSVSERSVDSVVDLDVLRKPSPFRKVLVGIKAKPYEMSTDSLETGLAEISAAYRNGAGESREIDCAEVGLAAGQQVKLDASKILEIVEREISAHPGCACETVKTVIQSSDADVDGVVAIVETAILAAPDKMRIISQCAIATVPESISAVQALLARLDPNGGDTGYSSKSAKGSKDAKVASITSPPLTNPLDVPPGGPPIMPPPIMPPPIIPPPVSEVDSSTSFYR